MTVYVDELRRRHVRPFRSGSAHLTADTEDELQAFASRLGLPRSWFQAARVPHYDITLGWYTEAVLLGAVFVPAKEQARRRIAARHDRS